VPTSRLGWRLSLAALLGATGVVAGAFGAHGLRGDVSVERLSVWETAAHYQLIHAVVLLALLGLRTTATQAVKLRWLDAAEGLIALGILVFSGSLYLLVLTDTAALGAVTPLGGMALIAGWGCLMLHGRALIRATS